MQKILWDGTIYTKFTKIGENREIQFQDCKPDALGHAVRIFRFVSVLFFSAFGNVAAQPIPAWVMDDRDLWCAGRADNGQHGALLYSLAPQGLGGSCESRETAGVL